MEEHVLWTVIDYNFIDKIKYNTLTQLDILNLINNPLKFVNIYTWNDIDALIKCLINNNITSIKGVKFSYDSFELEVKLGNVFNSYIFNKISNYIIYNKQNKYSLLYFDLNMFLIIKKDISKFIDISLVDNYVLKYLDISNSIFYSHENYSLLIKKIAIALKDINNSQLVYLKVNTILPEYSEYIEVLLKNKINLKYLFINNYNGNDNVQINYAIKALQMPLKNKLHTLQIKTKYNDYSCNMLYNFLNNNHDKLLDLRVVKIYFAVYETTITDSYVLFLNNLNKCLNNYKNLEEYRLERNYSQGYLLSALNHSCYTNYLKDYIKNLKIIVDLDYLDKYKLMFNLAAKYRYKDVNNYKLHINKYFHFKYNEIYTLNNPNKNLSNLLPNNISNPLNNKDINLINLQFIEYLPINCLINLDIKLIGVTELQFYLILDKLMHNSNTLTFIKIKLTNSTKNYFNNFDKFILFIKNAKTLKKFDFNLTNCFYDKLDLLIIFLVILYCDNINYINLLSENSLNPNYFKSQKCNKQIVKLCSRIDDLKNCSYLDSIIVVDCLISSLNIYYTKTNNHHDILDRLTVLNILKQRKIESILYCDDNLYYFLLVYYISLFSNVNILKYCHMIVKSFITKVTFDNIFQYIKNNSNNQKNNNNNIKLDKKSYYGLDYNLEYNQILTLIYPKEDPTNFYEYLLQMPYSIGYFKSITDLDIHCNVEYTQDNYIKNLSMIYTNIVLKLEKFAVIKKLRIIELFNNNNTISTEVCNYVIKFKKLTNLEVNFDETHTTKEKLINFLKKVSTNFLNLNYLNIYYIKNDCFLLVALIFINKFNNKLKSVKINYSDSIKNKKLLYLKIITILTNKTNINWIDKYSVLENDDLIRLLFKCFNKKSTIKFIRENLFYNYCEISKNIETKKLFKKFCKYNKLEKYL